MARSAVTTSDAEIAEKSASTTGSPPNNATTSRSEST